MDPLSFEARLRAEGFPEIRTNELQPGCHNAEHSHPFDVLALVLEGDITLTVEGRPRTYGVGEEFSMKAGCAHVEDVGAHGVKYLVGRRPLSDLEAVQRTLWTYLDGLYEGDTGKLSAAFHEESHLYSLAEGRLADLPRAKWLDIVAGRPSPKSRELKRTDRIVSIDFSGPETALAKVECSIHPRYFTDYLTLLKLGGGWRIVSKTFRADVRD